LTVKSLIMLVSCRKQEVFLSQLLNQSDIVWTKLEGTMAIADM